MQSFGRKVIPCRETIATERRFTRRIQNAIRKRIDSAELKPGDLVASERELARTHKVSLMTARHALAGLEREGVVERRRGAGTFVASPKIHFNKLMSYTEHMSSRGLAPRSRVLVAKIVEEEQEVAARLGLPATSALVKIERLRQTGEDPFALETCYLPASEFADLVDAPLGRVPCLPRWSTIMASNWPTRMRKSTPPQPRRMLPNCWACPAERSVLRIRQVIYSAKGKATIYGVGYYRSERHTLFIRRFR